MVIFLAIPVLFFNIYVLGQDDAIHIYKTSHYKSIAKIDKKDWGVLLNNSGSCILVDLNNSKHIKFPAIGSVKYFTREVNMTNEQDPYRKPSKIESMKSLGKFMQEPAIR